jgi:hypothetical protein
VSANGETDLRPKEGRRMIRRLVSAVVATALLATLAASAAFAGEVTGNGKSLHVDGGGKWGTGLHARSFCAFSGQEDLQFEAGGSKGDPGHAQSWGQIPKADRDAIGPLGFHPGRACNPNYGPPAEG